MDYTRQCYYIREFPPIHSSSENSEHPHAFEGIPANKETSPPYVCPEWLDTIYNTGRLLSNRARGEEREKKKRKKGDIKGSVIPFLFPPFFFLSFFPSHQPPGSHCPPTVRVLEQWFLPLASGLAHLRESMNHSSISTDRDFLLDLLHSFPSPQQTTDPSDYPCPSAYRHRSSTLGPLSAHDWEKRTNQHTHDVCCLGLEAAATRVAFEGAELPEATVLTLDVGFALVAQAHCVYSSTSNTIEYINTKIGCSRSLAEPCAFARVCNKLFCSVHFFSVVVRRMRVPFSAIPVLAPSTTVPLSSFEGDSPGYDWYIKELGVR